MRQITPKEMEAAARALITARGSNLGVEVTLPVIYPDGQCVSVIVTVEGGEYIVHDSGFGAMYLTSAGFRFTKKLTQRLVNLTANYGCDFIENRIARRCGAEQLSLAIAMVANASRTIGDQSLDVRKHVEREFKNAVSARLRDAVGDRARPNQEIFGSSGRRYRVGNIVFDRTKNHPVAFVESFANRQAISNHFMQFFDVAPVYPKVTKFSVYNEAQDIPASDLKILREVSDVIPYNETRRRFEALRAN